MIHEVIHLKDRYPFLGENGADPTLEVYISTNYSDKSSQEALQPGLLICPGGGYRFVSKREAEPVAMRFIGRGYRVFVLTYSVAPSTYPTALREVAGALELICENSGRWFVDTAKLAILGFSAGAHLAGHYSNCYASADVRQAFANSKGVQAAVLCYPVITADPRYRHTASFMNLSGHKEVTAEDVERFSLENLVTEQTPPTFLWHTRTDANVPVMNALLYAQALTEKGVDFTAHIYPEGKHGLSTVDHQVNDGLSEGTSLAARWVDEADAWLKLTL